ncbi:MAG: lytic transglycosylase domain-containing protein [Pseudomonadota bacterium]
MFTPVRIAAVALGILTPTWAYADIEVTPGYQKWPVPKVRPAEMTVGTRQICSLIAKASEEYGVPRDFFARLIWKESRFDIRAISPVGAQGIAQFMPTTARIRGLKDPFDPVQAIPASAHFLADLKARLGNYGLAAAGYNGGPDRVANWVAKGGGWLPTETINYVHSITFRPVDWFRGKGREVEPRPLEKGKTFQEACERLPIIRTRALAGNARISSPWGVQVAAGITRRAARRAFNRARSRLRSVIGGRGAIIVRERRGSVRRYSARVGASSRSAARRLCARIRAKGGACVVRRN